MQRPVNQECHSSLLMGKTLVNFCHGLVISSNNFHCLFLLLLAIRWLRIYLHQEHLSLRKLLKLLLSTLDTRLPEFKNIIEPVDHGLFLYVVLLETLELPNLSLTEWNSRGSDLSVFLDKLLFNIKEIFHCPPIFLVGYKIFWNITSREKLSECCRDWLRDFQKFFAEALVEVADLIMDVVC